MKYLLLNLLVTFVIIFFSIFVLSMLTPYTEAFGAFGCSKIPFEKLLVDTRTPSEHEEWKKNYWNKQNTNQKNGDIAQWDKYPCEEQNKIYKLYTDQKKKREAVDNI